MKPKTVPPTFAAKSFTCPHCGALADQTWFEVRARQAAPDGVWVIDEDLYKRIEAHTKFEDEQARAKHARYVRYAEKALTGAVYLWKLDHSSYDDYELANIHVSRCFSCGDVAVWKYESILFPPARFDIEPNADMPAGIRQDFEEARTILDLSPRGAAALLRLCIQKICLHLGKPGKSIDADIASLVKDGLDHRIQRALDVVRVVGNESVHPGSMDIRDSREIAAKLFELVNHIAYDRITRPKEIDSLYASLPAEKLAGIARRDAPKREPS
jgi:Domain of unknown function (DUF4145)